MFGNHHNMRKYIKGHSIRMFENHCSRKRVPENKLYGMTRKYYFISPTIINVLVIELLYILLTAVLIDFPYPEVNVNLNAPCFLKVLFISFQLISLGLK